MSNNYDPQLIIDFLNEKIKEAEESKEHWELNSQKPLADYYRKVAVNRLSAFKEVLEFIDETYKTDDNGK